jgi:hypothetical protein
VLLQAQRIEGGPLALAYLHPVGLRVGVPERLWLSTAVARVKPRRHTQRSRRSVRHQEGAMNVTLIGNGVMPMEHLRVLTRGLGDS